MRFVLAFLFLVFRPCRALDAGMDEVHRRVGGAAAELLTKVVREVTNPLRRALLLALVLVVGGCSDEPNGLYLDTQGRP